MQSPFLYFTDAVLRAPTIGCMLMCFSAALIGVVVVLRKQSLIGEALSHAAYPGVVLTFFSRQTSLLTQVDAGAATDSSVVKCDSRVPSFSIS